MRNHKSYSRHAFGLTDTNDGHTIVNHDFFGTSIRGLAVQGNELVTVHSMLNEFSRTDRNEIHWGVLMANEVRFIDVDLLIKERGDRIYVGGRVNPVGVPGNGAAEPTNMAIHGSTGNVAVAIVGLVDENGQKLFNPPSLRGVSQRGPEFFHDCRADGLRGVLVDKKHRLDEKLSEEQVADLLAFLNTL